MSSSFTRWASIVTGLGVVLISAVSLSTARTDSADPTTFKYAADHAPWHIEVSAVDGWQPALPNDWRLGEVSGVTVAPDDTVWVVHRPRTVPKNLSAAPALLHFAPDGALLTAVSVQSGVSEDHNWPESEHGLFLDAEGTLWLTGNGASDSHVIGLTISGDQVSKLGAAPSWYETASELGSPSDIWINPDTEIAYIADGYRNRRVVAFSTRKERELGSWQGHGSAFGLPVHCIRGSRDNRLYVCDRVKNRIQVFDIEWDGNLTWRSDIPIAPDTGGNGSVWDIAFSPDERLLFVADGENQRVWLLDRQSEEIVGHFGRKGNEVGEFDWIHHLDVDSLGNLYTTEVQSGRRIQKFKIRTEVK